MAVPKQIPALPGISVGSLDETAEIAISMGGVTHRLSLADLRNILYILHPGAGVFRGTFDGLVAYNPGDVVIYEVATIPYLWMNKLATIEPPTPDVPNPDPNADIGVGWELVGEPPWVTPPLTSRYDSRGLVGSKMYDPVAGSLYYKMPDNVWIGVNAFNPPEP